MENKRITLSGFAGSGKSTVGKILCDKLDYKFVSVGDSSREIAKERGLTINEFQEECKKDPKLDDLIDNKFTQLCNESNNIVADYRLGFHFIKNAFHVLLKISDEITLVNKKMQHPTAGMLLGRLTCGFQPLSTA